jgi:hypothetical protein
MHPYPHWPFLTSPAHPDLSALGAVLIHGLLAILVLAPLILRARHRLRLSLAAAAFANALDLDHALQAQSFSPRAMEHLDGRPDTHALLFAVLLALLVLLLSRRVLLAWAVFAIYTGHLLFDAAGGGERWLFPLRSPTSIPWLVCPLGLAVLIAVSWLLARMRDRIATRAPGRATLVRGGG